MQYPDEDLSTLQVSLEQFVKSAEYLHDQKDSPQNHGDMANQTQAALRFIRFVAAGRYISDNGEKRIFVNALQGKSLMSSNTCEQQDDIDSVIGVTKDLPFAVTMAIFPLPSFRDTLTKKNHLVYKRHASYDSTTSMVSIPHHKIPNIGFGKVDRRQISRIAFPWLYEKGKKPAIISEDRTVIYQNLRQAAIEVDPFNQGRWPVDVEEAEKLCRDAKGLYHFMTIDYPPNLLQRLGKRLLELFQKHERLRDAFFIHEFRGMKGGSRHSSSNIAAREQALRDIFFQIDTSRINEDDWVVDVGKEFRRKGHVMQWRTKGHHGLLRCLLPSAETAQISAVLKSKTQYDLDLAAQITDIGGFRSEPGSRGAADKVIYINVYSTDKNATYQLHKGLFRRRNPRHLLPDKISKLCGDIERIGDTFVKCGEHLEANARLEIRVPLKVAKTALSKFPNQLLESALVSFDMATFWYFKYYRLSALYMIIRSMQNMSPLQRIRNNSLTLGAMAIYQLNALIYRPQEGSAETEILHVACQHIPDEDDEGQMLSKPIMYQRGLYFLSDLVDNWGFVLPDARFVEEKTLLRIYGVEYMGDLQVDLQQKERLGRRRLQVSYDGKQLTQKRKRTLNFVEMGRNSSSSPSQSESDTDVEGENSSAVPLGTSSSGTSDSDLKFILKQFPTDILQLTPKSRTAGSDWLLLPRTPQAFSSVKVDMFKSLNIGHILSHVQLRSLDIEDWEILVFDRYFPRKDFKPPTNFQQYPAATYYQHWLKLTGSPNSKQEDIHQAALAWFKTLAWVPYPYRERMWQTQEAKGLGWIKRSRGALAGPCPRIALNAAVCKGMMDDLDESFK